MHLRSFHLQPFITEKCLPVLFMLIKSKFSDKALQLVLSQSIQLLSTPVFRRSFLRWYVSSMDANWKWATGFYSFNPLTPEPTPHWGAMWSRVCTTCKPVSHVWVNSQLLKANHFKIGTFRLQYCSYLKWVLGLQCESICEPCKLTCVICIMTVTGSQLNVKTHYVYPLLQGVIGLNFFNWHSHVYHLYYHCCLL